MGEGRSAMKQCKWYKKFKAKLAKLLLQWSLKLDSRYDINWPIGVFPQMVGYRRSFHIQRMLQVNHGELTHMKMYQNDFEVIKSNLARQVIDEIIKHMAHSGLISIRFEEDNYYGTLNVIAEVDILEPIEHDCH